MNKIIYCLISFFSLANSFAQQIDLKLNLSKGSTYYQSISGNSIVTQTIDGKEMIINLTINGRISYEVISIVDNLYNMQVSYKNLSMQMNMEGNSFEFNSDSSSKNNKVSKLLSQLIDKPFRVEMTNKGKLISVQNIDSIFSNIVYQFKELNEMQKQQLMKQLLSSYGEKAFEGNFNMFTAMFPSTKVSKGDTWQVKTDLELAMAATLETTYELMDITENYYEITGKSQLKTADKDAYKQINGLNARYDLSGTMITQIRISKATNWIIDATITQSMSGNVEIKDKDKMPEGMTIPMHYKGNIIFTGK
jgi:hypothetical protein